MASNAISNATSLLNLIKNVREESGKPDPELEYANKDPYLTQKVIPQLAGVALLRPMLMNIQKYMKENPESEAVKQTGPYLGEYWEGVPRFEGSAEPKMKHPLTTKMFNWGYGEEEAKKRADFAAMIRRLGETGFSKAGQAFTGTEAGITLGGLPSMLLEPGQNEKLIQANLEEHIPGALNQFRNQITSRGISEEAADFIINQFLRENQDILKSYIPKQPE